MKYEQTFQEALGSFSDTLARLKREDVGWLPLSAVEGPDSLITLDVIRDHSARARRLATLNPIVKRGLVVRTLTCGATLLSTRVLLDPPVR